MLMGGACVFVCLFACLVVKWSSSLTVDIILRFCCSGFDPERVYTSQGEMSRYQCEGCGHVWECVDDLRAIDAASPAGVLTDLSLALKCPQCGGGDRDLRPNLRGGDWFQHSPYLPIQEKLISWLDACVAERASVAVLEVTP